MSALQRALAPLAGRIQMMVARGTIAQVDDAPMLQTVQIELLDEETQDGVEHIHPYGLSTGPIPGAEAVALSAGGLRSHLLVIAVADRRFRMKVLEGEVALHDDQGQFALLGRDGIRVVSPLGIAFETDGDFSVAAGGDVSIVAGGETLVDGASIKLGAGASLDAARKTDTVNSTAITGGSGKVKIA